MELDVPVTQLQNSQISTLWDGVHVFLVVFSVKKLSNCRIRTPATISHPYLRLVLKPNVYLSEPPRYLLQAGLTKHPTAQTVEANKPL